MSHYTMVTMVIIRLRQSESHSIEGHVSEKIVRISLAHPRVVAQVPLDPRSLALLGLYALSSLSSIILICLQSHHHHHQQWRMVNR